jgi:hypothetical protein
MHRQSFPRDRSALAAEEHRRRGKVSNHSGRSIATEAQKRQRGASHAALLPTDQQWTRRAAA